jgi:hypothetical protein
LMISTGTVSRCVSDANPVPKFIQRHFHLELCKSEGPSKSLSKH